MKATYFTTAVMLLASTLLIGCEQTSATTEVVESNIGLEAVQQDVALQALTFSTNPDSVNTADEAGLLQMREEEKMAGDVYTLFYEMYNMPVFINIAQSEDRHSSAVLNLINYYGLTDPATSEAGVFSNQEIQTLYNQFIAQGNDFNAALSTGAYIEEYDIADLKKLIDATDNADIKLVYGHLLNGSANHLKAFSRLLSLRGVSYSPQILTQDEYNEIIVSD